jgi:hypothetical protein
MPRRRWPAADLLRTRAAALSACVVCFAAPANAWHTDEQRITDETAYTLRKHDVRLGIWKAQYGLFDSFHFGTYLWPWVFRVANLHAKWRYYCDDPLALSVQLGIFRLDTEQLRDVDEDAGSAVLTAVPLELGGSYRFDDRWTLGAAFSYTEFKLEGELKNEDFEGAAEGAVDNFQLTTTLEWRYTRVTAFTLHYRYLLLQRLAGGGDVVFYPDEFTTVEVHGAATTDALDFKAAFSITASAVFSWETFNLRAGLGYGNYNVPGINVVLPVKILYPSLDLYWIF